jgi:putative ABC transport system permease protein
VSLLERIVPPLRRLPIRWRMALRGIGRNPRRTIYTMLGVILSLILVLVSWGMIDTIEHLLDLQFTEIQQEDAAVRFADPASPDRVAALVELEGVAAVEPVVEIPVTLSAGDRYYDTLLNVLPADTEMHRFHLTDGSWGSLSGSGLLIGDAAAGLLEVAPGDSVTVTVAYSGGAVRVPVADLVDEPLGTVAYASREAAEARLGPLPATAALVRYEPGADPAELRAAVTELPEVAAFDDAKAIYNTVRDFMVLFYGFVGIMLFFGSAMAFALIFNAMAVNIAERSREVATLLAVGFRRRTISRLITAENMLVALLAVPPGLVVGHWVSAQAMATFESDLFSFDLFIRPTTYGFTALAILLVALLSVWPGLRTLRRVSIPETVKERST